MLCYGTFCKDFLHAYSIFYNFALPCSLCLNRAIFYSTCTNLLRTKDLRKVSTYPLVCLRFSQTLLHQDLGTFLRKKSLNLGYINDFVLFIITLLPWLNLQTKQSLFTIQDLDIFHFVFKPIYVHLCLPRRSDDRTGVNLRLNGYFFSALINKTADKERGIIFASSHTGNI